MNTGMRQPSDPLVLLNDYSNIKAFNRGVIDENGVVVFPCSVKYLHIISLEMNRAWAQSVIEEVDSTDDGAKEQRILFLLSEITRLLNNPDLFPFYEARIRFLATLALDSELRFHTTYIDTLIQLELDELQEITQQEYTRPTYDDGCTGWENFLLNMAPGAPGDPTNRVRTLPKTSMQILPPVGMRIVGDLVAEEKEILKYMEENRDQLDVTPASTTVMVDFDKLVSPERSIPMCSLPQQTYDATVRPNPFRHVSGSLPEGLSSVLPIERIGPFMHKLDNPLVAANAPTPALHAPDVFPQVGIRSWHPPTSPRDIRFDHS